MLLAEIKARIELLGAALNGYVVKRGSMPASPDEVIALQEYGGAPPTPGFGVAGIQFEMPGVQVFVRGKADQLDEPRLVIERIYQDLQKVQAKVLSGTRYLFVRPQQSPQKFEHDTARRYTYLVNFLCEKEPSAA